MLAYIPYMDPMGLTAPFYGPDDFGNFPTKPEVSGGVLLGRDYVIMSTKNRIQVGVFNTNYGKNGILKNGSTAQKNGILKGLEHRKWGYRWDLWWMGSYPKRSGISEAMEVCPWENPWEDGRRRFHRAREGF